LANSRAEMCALSAHRRAATGGGGCSRIKPVCAAGGYGRMGRGRRGCSTSGGRRLSSGPVDSLSGIAAVTSIEPVPAPSPTRCLQGRGRVKRPRTPGTSIGDVRLDNS
jgi:hypothetical protein